VLSGSFLQSDLLSPPNPVHPENEYLEYDLVEEIFWGDELSKSLSISLSKWHGKLRMDNGTVAFFSSMKISL
jgi:hypothetical protein